MPVLPADARQEYSSSKAKRTEPQDIAYGRLLFKRIAKPYNKKPEGRLFPVALENIEASTGKFLPTNSEFAADGLSFGPGDILLGKLSPGSAKVWVADQQGEAVGDFYVLRTTPGRLPEFYRYFLLAPEVQALLAGAAQGSTMPRVQWETLGQILAPNITEQEQHAIASFLDTQTGRIDRLIADYETMISMLREERSGVIHRAVTKGLNPDVPMKDSGVEWLGMVPEHWETITLGFLAILNPKVSFKEFIGEDELTFLPMEQIKRGYYLPNNAPLDRYNTSYNAFEEGDIVLAKVTPCFENGNLAIANGLTRGKGFGTSEIFVLRPLGISRKFLFYYLASSGFKNEGIASMAGAGGLKRIPSEFMRKHLTPFPPLPEQHAIATYLDSETARIDSLIADAERAIELLKENRAVLISDAVTGKLRVPAVAVE